MLTFVAEDRPGVGSLPLRVEGTCVQIEVSYKVEDLKRAQELLGSMSSLGSAQVPIPATKQIKLSH